MFSRYTSIFSILFLVTGSVASGQSASLTEDITNESAVRSATSNTITVTVTGDTLNSNIGSDALATADFLAGMSGSAAWAGVVAGIGTSDVVLSDADRVATITVTQNSDYYITANDVIDFVIPAASLKSGASIDVTQDVIVLNESPTLSFGGDLADGELESGIRTSNNTFEITVSGNLWLPDITSDAGALASIKGMFSGAPEFAALVASLTSGDLELTGGGTVLTITFDAEPLYDIASDETVNINVPTDLLEYPESYVSSTTSFTISSLAPYIDVTGTFLGVTDEGDIRTNSYQIDITVFEDTWVSDIDTDPAKTEGLINGLGSSPASSGFDALLAVIIGGDQGVSSVSLSGNTVRISVPSYPGFDITEDLDLSISADASYFTNASTALSENNFFTLQRIEPYITIASDPSPLNEENLDESELIVTVHEDEWIAGGFSASAFTLNENPNLVNFTVKNDFTRVSDQILRVRLNYNGPSFSDDRTLGLSVAGSMFLTSTPVTSVNTLTISAIIEPVITGVSIPNAPIGIGDLVTATITVEDDDGNDFEFVQGTIAGRSLTNLRRNGSSSTSYLIDFNVTAGSEPQYAAGDSIPITNLQLRNGTALGNIYNDYIKQNDDPIDTEAPTVNLISFNNGSYRVGDKVTATINGNEPGLNFNTLLTTINGVPVSPPKVTGYEAGAGIYQLDYIVEEGDPDVPAPGPIGINVVLEDYSDNQGSYSIVSGVSPVIDANSPVIDSMRVTTSGVVSSTSDIEIVIDAVEPDLDLAPGSHVNNVYFSSGRLSLIDDGGGFYRLIYDIGPEDNGVPSGDLTASIVLRDDAGNTSVAFTILKNNTVAIVTEGPNAIVYGGGEVCEGESANVYLNIDGEGPFDVTIDANGSFYDMLNDIPSSYTYEVNTVNTLDFTVASVTDALGNTGTTEGHALVTVNSIPVVNLNLPRTTYQVTEDSVSLTGTGSPLGGTYSGEGVLSSDELFSPKIVGLANSPATIYYSYTDPATGCSGEASETVTIIEGQAQFTTFPETGVICFGETGVSIAAVNNYNIDGRFDITFKTFGDHNHVYTEIAGKDSIVLNTSLFNEEGSYIVRYSYEVVFYDPILGVPIGVIPYNIEQSFFVEILDQVKYISRPPATICNDQSIIDLESNLDDPNIAYSFSGSGVTGDPSFGYSFNPGAAALGVNQIDYEMTSNKGCTRTDAFTVEVFDVPTVNFQPQSVCISLDGGPIGFENLTDKEGLVSEWRWEFGDVNSGVANTDTFAVKSNPIHEYTAPGTRTVSLEVLTSDGCINKTASTFDFGDKPIADFRWNSDCYLPDIPVTFVNESFTERTWIEDLDAVIDSVAFTYEIFDEQMNLVHTIESTKKENVEYGFEQLDDYYVRLVAVNDLLCSDTLTDLLVLKPTTSLREADYIEAFGTRGFWSTRADSLSETNSWVYDVPDFRGYEKESEDTTRAWFTRFKDDVENLEERSWMQSPCFDFRETERPMIRMDIMKSFDFNRDGAVLQYSLDNGKNWTTVGNIGEGINWYNSFDIKEKPGGNDGSSIGWSGNALFAPDSSWVNVAHDLDGLIGEESVIFGMFYATDGASVIANQGVAIDNIYIGERSKRAVIEHFTNAGDASSVDADRDIDNFEAANAGDVVSLQYHMHFPGRDPFNESNPAPSSSRSFYYGVNQVPYAIMDGGLTPEYIYDFSNSLPTSELLKNMTLEDPEFELGIKFQLYDSRLQFTTIARALKDRDSSEVVLQVAIVERLVTGVEGNNGDTEFRNVVLDMIPSPAGTLYSKSWVRNETETYTYSWSYDHVEDLSDLMVVTFLQDRETKKILQVATAEQSEFGVPARDQMAGVMHVYPNPFGTFLRVDLGGPVREEGMLLLTDVSGRVVWNRDIVPGDHRFEIRADHLEGGVYFLLLEENGSIRGRATVINRD